MHNWLVRFVLEVGVPALPELWTHFLKFLFCGSDLYSRINSVCCKRSCTVQIPLVENSLLYLRVATEEVIEGFCVRLGTVYGKGEVMVLN